MAEAIFGLVGVIIGAVVASVGDLALERRRERKAVRRAARLVGFELVEIYAVLGAAAIGRDPFPADKKERLSTNAWQDFRDTLAGGLAAEAWTRLATAYRVIEMVNGLARERDQPLRPHRPVQDVEWLRQCARDVRIAVDGLHEAAEWEDDPADDLPGSPTSLDAEMKSIVEGADAQEQSARQT